MISPMKKVVVAALLVYPMFAGAGSFDGTWTVEPHSFVWVHAKPATLLLQGGRFTCGAGFCSPPFTVPADGRPHRVKGHQSYNNVAVTVLNARTVTLVARRGDAKDWECTYAVTEDGNTLASDCVQYGGGKSATSRWNASRALAGASGNLPLSGSWLPDLSSLALSPQLATITFREIPGGLQMTDPLGERYDARFDGRQYLTQGDPTHTLVTIERLGPGEIRETDRNGGKISAVLTMQVAEDGKTMQILDERNLTGASWKYLLKKAAR